MGFVKPDSRSDAHVIGAFSRIDSSRISNWGFQYQYYHTAHAVLSVGRYLRSALCETYGHRHARVIDVSLFHGLFRSVERSSNRILVVGDPLGLAGNLLLPTVVGRKNSYGTAK